MVKNTENFLALAVSLCSLSKCQNWKESSGWMLLLNDAKELRWLSLGSERTNQNDKEQTRFCNFSSEDLCGPSDRVSFCFTTCWDAVISGPSGWSGWQFSYGISLAIWIGRVTYYLSRWAYSLIILIQDLSYHLFKLIIIWTNNCCRYLFGSRLECVKLLSKCEPNYS